MNFSCNYDSLITNLQDIASIVEDPLAAEDDKSIIFMFKKSETGNTVRLIGVSPVITFKRDIPESDYHLTLDDEEVDENGVKYVVLKSKELLGFLNTYKNLRKTKVDEVIFEQVRNKIKCVVVESLKFSKEELDKINTELQWNPDAHDQRAEKFYSSWMFDSVPLMPKKLAYVNLEAPDVELEQESGNDEFKLLSKSMIPIVDSSSTIYGSLNFDDDYIVAFSNAFVAIMCNFIPGNTFKKIKLTYRTLAFINKIISTESDIRYAKTDKHVYFKTDKSEAFITYNTQLAPYETHLKLYNPKHMVSISRLYIKDVIKRFSLINDNIEVTIDVDNDMIKMSNSKFSQDIPILEKSEFDEIGLLHFKIMPTYLNNAIIGDDTFTPNSEDSDSDRVYIYCNKENNIICLGDCTKSWFTVLSTELY